MEQRELDYTHMTLERLSQELGRAQTAQTLKVIAWELLEISRLLLREQEDMHASVRAGLGKIQTIMAGQRVT